MGRRVMSLLRENRDKSFFFAFGAGMAWFFLFYSVTMIGSKVFGMLQVSGPVRRFLRRFLRSRKTSVCPDPLVKGNELL